MAQENDWSVIGEHKDEGFSAYSGNRFARGAGRCLLVVHPYHPPWVASGGRS